MLLSCLLTTLVVQVGAQMPIDAPPTFIPVEEIQQMIHRTRASGSKRAMDDAARVLREQHLLRRSVFERFGLEPPRQFGFKPDFFEAQRYELMRAGYPNDYIDHGMYLRGIDHVAKMPSYQQALTGDPGIAVAFTSNWYYRGPNNLDIPYRQYWGTRPVSGRINAVLYDVTRPQDTYYIGAGNGGVWKTTDGGVNWRPLSDDWDVLAVSSLAMDPGDNRVVFAGTGDRAHRGSNEGAVSRTVFGVGIMRSTDRGTTWTNVGRTQMIGSVVTKILIDPEDPTIMLATCAGGSNQGVYRSTDRGLTWARITALPQARFVRAAMSGADGNGVRRYYATAEGTANAPARLWTSIDRGVTWTQRTIPVTAATYSLTDVAASPVARETAYLLVCNEREVHRSTDGGATWTDITGNFPNGDSNYNWSQATYDWYIEATRRTATSNLDALHVGLIDPATSLNATATWRSIGGPTYDSFNALTHNDQHAFAARPNDPTEFLIGNDGGIYRVRLDRSTGVATYTNLNRTLRVTMLYFAAWAESNRTRILSGAQDNASPVSTDDLGNWRAVVGGDGAGVSMLQSNTDRQYGTNQFLGTNAPSGDNSLTLWLTQHNWFFPARQVSVDVSSTEINNGNIPFIGPLATRPSTDQTFVGTNRMYRWTDDFFGGNWGARISPSLCGANNFVTAISATETRVVAGTSDGRIWFGTGNSSIWSENFRVGLPSRPVLGISQRGNEVIVTLGGAPGVQRVWITTNITDQTRSWFSVSGFGNGRLPDVPTSAIVRDLQFPDSTWYVGTDLGVFFTNNSGGNWFDMTHPLGLPMLRVSALGWNTAASGGIRLNCATYGRGIWRIDGRTGEPWIGNITAPSSLVGGQEALCFVELSRPAPQGGLVMRLTSSNTNALTVPGSINIPEGLTGAFFRATSRPVQSNTVVTIDIDIGGDQREIDILVQNTMVESFTVTPEDAIGGQVLQARIKLIGPAPDTGYRLTLASEGARAALPSEVYFAPDTDEKIVPIGTQRVTEPTLLKLFCRWRNMQEVRSDVMLRPY